MFEIERKFLIDITKWDITMCSESFKIKQGYIFDDAKKGVLRVRTKADKGFLTIKSANAGLKRLEFEYEIPIEDAENLLQMMCEKVLSKTRYHYHLNGKLWEIDVFHGKLSPLILAEIELVSENESFEIPNFIQEEVTGKREYYNSELIKQL